MSGLDDKIVKLEKAIQKLLTDWVDITKTESIQLNLEGIDMDEGT